MRDLACFLLGALFLILLAAWVSRHRPQAAELAWRVLDRADKLPLFESAEPCEGSRQEEARASPRELPETPRPELPRPRKRLTQLMKKRIAARDAWRCQLCKRLVSHTYEIDHIKPQSEGGGHEDSNLRTLCRECHGVVTAQQRLKP